MPRTRPEQLGWDLSQNIAITASGNYFVIDKTGNLYLTTGSLFGTASYALNSLSSSYALTSSYVSSLGSSNYTQSFFNSSTWTLNHNLKTQFVIIQTYDLNYEEIIPQTIDLINENTAIIKFPTLESGYAVASVGGVLSTGNFSNTGSFTGSFVGDGSELINIPASSITGLNLNQIASGSLSASIAPSTGFTLNTNESININGTSTIALNMYNSAGEIRERVQVDNSGNNATAGTSIWWRDVIIRYNGSLQSQNGQYREQITYNGNGTDRRGRYLAGVAHNSGYGGSQLLMTQTPGGMGQQKITAIGYNVNGYIDDNFTSSVSYAMHAQTIINGGNGSLHTLAIDREGATQHIFLSNGNIVFGGYTDAGYKLDVNGTGRFTSNVQITGSLTLQPTSSATQTVAIIQAGSGSIALVPGVSGSIVASIPDGTAVGGNARGIGAVDLQTSRTNANQVASGDGSFVVGQNNRAANAGSIVAGRGNTSTSDDGVVFGTTNSTTNASQSSILGGYLNTISVTRSTIAGGQSNNITAANCFIGGGNSNTASSQLSVVSGGASNTASTGTHATVVGGNSNTASGQYSVSGGWNNIASGLSSVALGRNNTASNQYAVALGGYSQATATYSTAINSGRAYASFSFSSGDFAYSYLLGQISFAGSSFGNLAQTQQSLLTSFKEAILTTAATSSLSLDGTGTTNLIIPSGNNRAWHTTVDTVATVTTISGSATGVTVGDSFMQTDKLLFKRIGGTSSVVGRSTTETIYDTSMSTALMSFTAGSSQELAITFTAPTFSGGGSITCRVVSKVSLVEVAY